MVMMLLLSETELPESFSCPCPSKPQATEVPSSGVIERTLGIANTATLGLNYASHHAFAEPRLAYIIKKRP